MGDLKITTNREAKDNDEGPVVLIRSGFLIPAGTPLRDLDPWPKLPASGVLMSDTLQFVVILTEELYHRDERQTEVCRTLGHEPKKPRLCIPHSLRYNVVFRFQLFGFRLCVVIVRCLFSRLSVQRTTEHDHLT